MLLEPPFLQYFGEVCNGSIVEAPLALFCEQMKVLRRNSVEAAHVSFCLVPEVLDAIDMIGLVRKQFTMVYANVMKFRDIENIIAAEAISVDN